MPKVLLELRAVADEARNAAAYRRIEVPTCLVGGLWSPEPAQRLTSMFADILPHASCFEVAAGHMAPITHPALVNPIFEEIHSRGGRERTSSPRLATPKFSELTAVVRGQGWSRAIAFGLSGLALSVCRSSPRRASGSSYFGDSSGRVPIHWRRSAWHEAPPGMPPGGTFAVISGDPLEAGPFVMRVRLPPGYMLPPYRRPNEEQMIVLAGAITVGTGGSLGRSHANPDRGCVRVAAGKRASFCAHAERRHRADLRHWPIRDEPS